MRISAIAMMAIVFLSGCAAEEQFIPLGENPHHDIKRKLSEVAVFTDPKQVPGLMKKSAK